MGHSPILLGPMADKGSFFGPFRQICFTNRLPGNGCQDDSAALAFLGRLTHHCEIVETGNESRRFKNRAAQHKGRQHSMPIDSFLTSLCGPAIRLSCRSFWTHLLSVESQTPKYDAACCLVRPLVVAMRTGSRRNASVYLVAISCLRHSKYCSKETGTEPCQVQNLQVTWRNRA